MQQRQQLHIQLLTQLLQLQLIQQEHGHTMVEQVIVIHQAILQVVNISLQELITVIVEQLVQHYQITTMIVIHIVVVIL